MHGWRRGAEAAWVLSVFLASMKEAVLRFSIWRPPYVYAPTSILGWQCRQEGVGMESGPAIPRLARELTPKRRQRLAGEAARRHILSCCSNAARPPGRNSRTPERTAVLLSVSAFWSSCGRSLSGHQNRARLPLGTACEGPQSSDCFRVIM